MILSESAEWDEGDDIGEVLQVLDCDRIDDLTDDIRGTACEQCLGLLRYADANGDSHEVREAAETLKQWFDIAFGD